MPERAFGQGEAVTLAWPALNELSAYRITDIPRPDDGEPDAAARLADPGRAQRQAALVAAYHAGLVAASAAAGALAVGWVRQHVGGPVQLLVAGAGLVGREDAREALLTLPGGARAEPLPAGELARRLAELPSWRPIGVISDGLGAEAARDAADRLAPSLEDGLLAVWPEPFGWLLVAEPAAEAEILRVAEQVARREEQAAGQADRFPERATEARRLRLRHAELQQSRSTGLWQVRLAAGGTDPDAAARVAGLVCASADLAALPYALAPARDGRGWAARADGGSASGGGRRRRRARLPGLRRQRAGRGAHPPARARGPGGAPGAAARLRRDPGTRPGTGDDPDRPGPRPEPAAGRPAGAAGRVA